MQLELESGLLVELEALEAFECKKKEEFGEFGDRGSSKKIHFSNPIHQRNPLPIKSNPYFASITSVLLSCHSIIFRVE